MSQSLQKQYSSEPLKFRWKRVTRPKGDLLHPSVSVTLVGTDVYWLGTNGNMAMFSCKTWNGRDLNSAYQAFNS